MIVGPTRLRPMLPGRTGARAAAYSSSQMTRSISPAPRPPYSFGQVIPTQPAACIVFCHARRRSNVSRSDATRSSAGSSRQRSAGRFAASQPRSSVRNASWAGENSKSIDGESRLVGSLNRCQGDRSRSSAACLPDLRAAVLPRDRAAPLVDSGRLGHPQRHGHRSLKPFLHHRGADSLARAKEEAAIFAPTPSTPTINPLVASTVVTGFDGINEEQSFAEPPDGAIAVSPTYIVEAVNDELSVWTKTYDATGQLSSVTNVVSAASLDVFFGHNPNCYTGANDVFGLVSDPSLDYDAAHDRFMLSMISFDRFLLISSLCVAVTTTGDPSGTWFVYAFNIQPAFNSLLDFPRAVTGSDGQIYVTGNLFTFDVLGNPVFQNARAYAFKASDMYVGSATTGRVVTVGNDPQTGAAADSLTPARAVGVAGMYFVSASNAASTGSGITLWRWTDPFGRNAFTPRGWGTGSPYSHPAR